VSDCYWMERPGTLTSTTPREVTVTPAALKMHNDCTPCCKCEDFVATKQTIDLIYADYVVLGSDSEDIRDIYSLNRTRWNQDKACREANPQRLVVSVTGGCHVGIGYVFCHMSETCKKPLVVTFTFTSTGHNPLGLPLDKVLDVRQVPGVGRKNDTESPRMTSYVLSGTYPTLVAHWTILNVNQSARLSFLLKACDALDGDSLTVTVNTVFGTESFPELTETVGLDCRPLDADVCS
jgi:hypothetical protein